MNRTKRHASFVSIVNAVLDSYYLLFVATVFELLWMLCDFCVCAFAAILWNHPRITECSEMRVRQPDGRLSQKWPVHRLHAFHLLPSNNRPWFWILFATFCNGMYHTSKWFMFCSSWRKSLRDICHSFVAAYHMRLLVLHFGNNSG